MIGITGIILLSLFLVSCKKDTNQEITTTDTDIQIYTQGKDSEINILSEKSGDNNIKKNKELVLFALTQILDTANVSMINEYFHEDVIEHNPNISGGRAGLKEIAISLKNKGITTQREITRVIAEKDIVVTQSRILLGEESLIVSDMFRIKDNKIIEHWDVSQEEVKKEKSVNGNSMIDGGGDSSLVLSQEDLNANKQTIRDFIEKGFAQGDVKTLKTLFGDEYIQHNPQVPNGIEPILGFMKDGEGFPVKIHKITGQGDLVTVFVEYGKKELGFHNACFDTFRLDDNNKVVEHWDTCMAVPSNEESKNSNNIF